MIGSITGSVSQLKALVGDVREGSRQQSEGIAQVSQAIVQMERVTQSTAATAEETAFASAALNGHAETSMVVVGRLATLVERTRAAVAGRTATGRNHGGQDRGAGIEARAAGGAGTAGATSIPEPAAAGLLIGVHQRECRPHERIEGDRRCKADGRLARSSSPASAC